MEKLEKLKKSLDNKFIPDNMKDKIRAEIKKLESEIKTDETMTATEVKEEVKEIEEKVEKALEVAEKKEEQAEAKAEEKKEKAPRKAREKKASTSKTKTQKVEPKATAKKKSVFSIAKEIRKDGESWEEAKKRATKMMKSDTTETKKKVRTETDKLLAMVRRNKEYKKLSGSSDLPKDAQRRALPRGKRVSADGNVYYENRANRVDVGGFKNAYLENGGGVDGIIELKPLELIPLSTQLNRLSGYNWTYGDWESEDGGKPSTMPNSVIVNVHTKQKFRLSPFKIYEGIDHYNNKPLYRVEDMSEDGEYVGEWYKTRQEAEDELREMFGNSYDNGGSVDRERFNKFISSQINYIISLKTISQKREPIQNLINNMDDYSGEEIQKRITKDNLKYALQQKTVSKINEVLRISLNALKYADGGTIIGTPETPLARGLDMDYTTLVGETGAMSSGEMFAGGGELKKYINQNWKKTNRSTHGFDVYSKEIDEDTHYAVFDKKGNFLSRSKNNPTQAEIEAYQMMTKYAEKGVYVETLDKEIDLSEDGRVRARKTQEGKNLSYGELREKHGASPEALAFDNGGSIGSMINFEDWQLYDRDTDLERMKKSCNAVRKNGFKAIVVQDKSMYYVLYKSMSDSQGKRVYDGGGSIHEHTILAYKDGLRATYFVDKKTDGYKIIRHTGSVLMPFGSQKEKNWKNWFKKNVDTFEVIYAEGGSLGNHGLKQGDQIIKTMSGGVQKVKTRTGDIVYVNLANGYRGATPPLPFDGGGRLKSALMRDRNNVNYSEDYEVRYSKDKSHRSGYTKPKMSRTQFEEETFEFFDGGGKLKKGRYSILGEVDGEQPLLYATTDDKSKIKSLVDMAEVDFYELTGKKHKIFVTDEVTDDEVYNYGNGGRTRERKYVNHSEDYEVRYSKDKPHRRGYGYEEGGFIEGFNPKSFSLAEIDEKLRDNDIYIQWLQMGDMSTSADKRDFLWTNTRSSTQWNKVKDLRLTISDYGLLELSKGSENLYLNFVVYEKNGYDPMNIQIYTKDNHAGLKQFARQIVDKFEEGGFMSDPNFGEFQNQVYAEKGAKIDNTFNYMMLSRLQQDCDYYLGYGNRNEKVLWAGNVDDHIEEMKKLWNALPKNAKPEWLSMDDILDYENKMKSDSYATGGRIETKIQKKVDEVNILIEKAVDSDGDPLMVVDKTGTWEEPMQYKPIVYKNGRLYIEYFEPYSGKTEKEVINKSNMDFDGYSTLLNIAKMYRKALKEKGISYSGGGKTTFKEKATAIAKNFEGKKVEPKYQKEYGKVYDKAEAKEVGNKIAGSQKAKYDSKMSGGGSTKTKTKTASNNTMVLAKQIRKDGESWQSAMKRAKEQLAKK